MSRGRIPRITNYCLSDWLYIMDDPLGGAPSWKAMAISDFLEKLDGVYVKGDRLKRPLYESIYSDIRYNRSIVSLRFDDGRIGDHTTIFPLLTARNLVASFALISDRVETPGVTFMSAAQCLELQESGMEMCCHSKSHGTDPSDFAEFVEETTDARDTLNTLGIHTQSFIQPGDWAGEHHYDSIGKINNRAARELRSEFAAFYAYSKHRKV